MVFLLLLRVQQLLFYYLLKVIPRLGVTSGQFSQPADIAIDSKENVFVTDITAASSKAVQKFNQNGTFISSWGEAGYDPGSFARTSDIATEAQGNVSVLDARNPDQVVQKFTNNGTFISTWGSH